MILLYLVDVPESRKECEAFVEAEASKAAFSASHFDTELVGRGKKSTV